MIGQKLGNRYEVVRELGRGGMGVVLLARDVLLERDVAVKLIGANELSAEARARFLREARVIAKMDHRGIVSVYDIGEQGDALFLVMAFIPGSNLRELFERGGRLAADEVIDLGTQACEALEHAHSIGIVHRDVKPENIMVVGRGENMRVLLADFGLATALSEQKLTRPGTVMGTVAYMSPEQVAGRAVDGRADIYALGTVLFECFAGDVPFPGGDLASMLYRIAHQAPPALRSLAPAVHPELEAVIMRCLEKDPASRPQRPLDVAEALQGGRATLMSSGKLKTAPIVLQHQATVLAPPRQPLARPATTVTRGRSGIWIAAALGVATVGGLAGVALRGGASRTSMTVAPASASVPASASASVPASAPAPCDRYCDLVMKNCTGDNAEYLSRSICMKMCPAFEIGATSGDTAHATLGCRVYHANEAATAPAEHCRAAGPLGGRRCGKDPCEPFCTLAVTYCAPPKAVPYPGGIADCQAACKTFPYLVGDAGDTTFESGNTLNCRLWHLETAYTSDDFGMFHCPHAKRISSTCF